MLNIQIFIIKHDMAIARFSAIASPVIFLSLNFVPLVADYGSQFKTLYRQIMLYYMSYLGGNVGPVH